MPICRVNPEFLHTSLDSILRQTFDNIEVLIIFDKSAPKSDDVLLNVLGEYCHDNRVKLFIRKNRGAFPDALNKGILLSKGDYIARMDSDDVCSHKRLETSLAYINNTEADLVGSWAYAIAEDGKILAKLTPPSDASEIRRMIMLHNPFIHSSILFRRDLIRRIGGYNAQFDGAEDYELYLRALSAGCKLCNIPEFLVYLRENPDSVTRGKKWLETRLSYVRAKFIAITKYGYLDWYDVLYGVLSSPSILVTPSLAPRLKSLVGWYRPLSTNAMMNTLEIRNSSRMHQIAEVKTN